MYFKARFLLFSQALTNLLDRFFHIGKASKESLSLKFLATTLNVNSDKSKLQREWLYNCVNNQTLCYRVKHRT